VGGGADPGGRDVTGYLVVCEGGETRHPGVFATRRDANHWADHGHCCTATHQIRTVENYLYLRDNYPDCPWVPVLQGWTLEDYAFCLKLYHHHDVDLASLPLVAVGSVCRRQSTHQIGDIFRFLSGEGLACHGFGVKLEGVRKYGQFLASSDSMAWSAGARRNPRMEACTHPGTCANCWRRAIAWRREVMQVIGSLDGACSPG